jgi:hypothetical protein
MKIAFCPVHLSERGTSVAVYDYAYYNEILLKNESIIIYQNNHYVTNKNMENKFRKRFKCLTYNNFGEVDNILENENVDAFYIIKYGNYDGLISKKYPNLIHSVFVSEPHGNIYAYVSKHMQLKFNNNIPYVPHMIDLPNINENLREQLKIPQDAVVFGCYGGKDSFNIKFVHETINEIINEYPNVYFLFMNLNQNTKNHERIIYLKGSSDMEFKVKFINTCDAMIHARDIGETFGLSCGEFSSRGKSVITYYHSDDKEHIRILGNRGIYYFDKDTLKQIFGLFANKNLPIKNVDYNCYREYNPEIVMKIFDDIFLEPVKKVKK